MKDCNAAIQQKLYDLLSPAVGVPVSKGYSVTDDDAYVLISTINSNDRSTMHSSDTDTVVQLSIYTKDSQANPGDLVNTIAAAIYATIYPNPQSTIDLSPDFQNCVLRLVNDTGEQPILTGTNVFINRFISFRLIILHN